jgi:hypothetical protein
MSDGWPVKETQNLPLIRKKKLMIKKPSILKRIVRAIVTFVINLFRAFFSFPENKKEPWPWDTY